MTVALILGVLVGAVLGLTGAGGGILAVPVLVFGLGWSMQQAAPVALVAVAAAAAVGAFEGWRQRLVRYRGALLMALAGILSTPFGLWAAHRLPQRWLAALFALLMLSVALHMLRNGQEPLEKTVRPPVNINPVTGRFQWNLTTAALLATIGAVTGFAAGLLGVGGGFVMVPLLRRYSDVSLRGIVATSLLVTAIVAIAGVISALAHGVTLPLPETSLFAAAVIGGMLAGRLLSGRVPARQAQIGFAILLIGVAAAFLGKLVAGL